MTFKALVVDDDPNVLEIVGDILKSLGHKYDMASCQEEARQLLAKNRYAYYLVDLELPVLAGRSFPRIQDGENLVREIVRQRGARREPVIIMTGHGTNGPQLAVRMMKLGANDYVTKPFSPTGDTLDKAIREALGGNASEKSVGLSPPVPVGQPVPFEGGDLTFYSDRVELCGVTVLGECCQMRRILEELRGRRSQAKYVALSGAELAKRLRLPRGQNAIAEAVKDFRKVATKVLKEQGILCQRQDIIRSGGPGYRLAEWIVVRTDGDSDPVADSNGDGRAAGQAKQVPRQPPGARKAPMTTTRTDDSESRALQHRRDWVLRQLEQGRCLRTPDVVAGLKCSLATAKRTLDALRAEGAIGFVGSPRTGHYRLGKAASE